MKREEDNDMLLNILDVVKSEDKKSRNHSKMSQKKKVNNFHVQSNELDATDSKDLFSLRNLH